MLTEEMRRDSTWWVSVLKRFALGNSFQHNMIHMHIRPRRNKRSFIDYSVKDDKSKWDAFDAKALMLC